MSKRLEDIVDISKVGNLNAQETGTGQSLVNEELRKKQQTLGTNKFIPTETTRIFLPSKGIPYKEKTNDPDVQEGYVVMREMKGHDEKLLATPRFIKDGSVFRRLLNNCIVSNIDAEDLILMDFNYLLFALRAFSYGDDYKFKTRCRNSFCEKEIMIDSKISDISWEEMPDDFKEPIKIVLPKSGYKIECILPRQYHTELFKKEEDKEEAGDSSKALIKKLVYTTVSIMSPDGNEVNKKDYEVFFGELSAKDTAELREKTKFKTDIEEMEVICPFCASNQKISIPMGPEFFRF